MKTPEKSEDFNDDHAESDDCLTLLELDFLINMIDQVSKRGAFYTSEFIDVGIIYNRLNAIKSNKTCKTC